MRRFSCGQTSYRSVSVKQITRKHIFEILHAEKEEEEKEGTKSANPPWITWLTQGAQITNPSISVVKFPGDHQATQCSVPNSLPPPTTTSQRPSLANFIAWPCYIYILGIPSPWGHGVNYARHLEHSTQEFVKFLMDYHLCDTIDPYYSWGIWLNPLERTFTKDRCLIYIVLFILWWSIHHQKAGVIV